MKKILYILSLIVAFSVVSCVDLYEINHKSEETQKEEGWYLADFSADNYPEGDTWTILDEKPASNEDFYGFSSALFAEYHSAISLRFPNLTTLPDDSILSDMCGKIASIYMPKVIYIGANNFSWWWSLLDQITITLSTEVSAASAVYYDPSIFSYSEKGTYIMDLIIGSDTGYFANGTYISNGNNTFGPFKSVTFE